jgi:hypothetical protein
LESSLGRGEKRRGSLQCRRVSLGLDWRVASKPSTRRQRGLACEPRESERRSQRLAYVGCLPSYRRAEREGKPQLGAGEGLCKRASLYVSLSRGPQRQCRSLWRCLYRVRQRSSEPPRDLPPFLSRLSLSPPSSPSCHQQIPLRTHRSDSIVVTSMKKQH